METRADHQTFWAFILCQDLKNIKVWRLDLTKCMSYSTNKTKQNFDFKKSLIFTIIANISRLESNHQPKICQNINIDVKNVLLTAGLDSLAIVFRKFSTI